jgi:hypothetical protein
MDQIDAEGLLGHYRIFSNDSQMVNNPSAFVLALTSGPRQQALILNSSTASQSEQLSARSKQRLRPPIPTSGIPSTSLVHLLSIRLLKKSSVHVGQHL